MSKCTDQKASFTRGAHITLPKRAAAGLGLGEGDEVFLVEGPDGMRLTRFDPDFERKMKALDRTMERYDDTLSRLAR